MRKIFRHMMVVAPVFVAILLFVGCISTPPTFVNLDLNIRTNELTNAGKVFYAVVRSDDEKDFVRATYETIYDTFLADKNSTNIFIKPKKDCFSKSIRLPYGSSVSVYFMFSKAGGRAWKYRIKKLEEDMTYDFSLGDNYISKAKGKTSSIF